MRQCWPQRKRTGNFPATLPAYNLLLRMLLRQRPIPLVGPLRPGPLGEPLEPLPIVPVPGEVGLVYVPCTDWPLAEFPDCPDEPPLDLAGLQSTRAVRSPEADAPLPLLAAADDAPLALAPAAAVGGQSAAVPVALDAELPPAPDAPPTLPPLDEPAPTLVGGLGATGLSVA